MKNYQPIAQGKSLVLKISLLLLVSIFYSSTYAQTEVTDFNYEKEKQKALKEGVHLDELEGYLNHRKSLLKIRYDFKTKGIGTLITKPKKESAFVRKSGSNCVGDFENGTVSPWSGWTGANSGIADAVSDNIVYTSGIVASRHGITSTGSDPVVSSISTVHNGSHSLKLGNSFTGAQTERVSRNVTVTGNCFSFWYALVFQNPNHPYNDQPFFMFRIKDSLGNLIDSFVRQASNSPFFSNQGSIRYKDWTKYSVNLNGYVGQTVEIEFTTADCRQTAHYGYAYVDDVCFEDCCKNCTELFRNPGLMPSYNAIRYSHSTETHCCYDFIGIFDYDIFACDPFGVRVYEDGNPSSPYVNYLGSTGMVYGTGSTPFDASQLDFCISKSDFNGQSKTIRIEFLNLNGDVICDTMTQVLEPCHSSSSGCDCDNLFSHPDFAKASIISRDTNSGNQYECCFRVNPYTDEDKLNCPYYGIRVYKDSTAYYPAILDTLSSTPMGGPGSTYPDSLNYLFCIPSYILANNPMTIRIEYLDSSGKVICSKTEEIDCELSCCEEVNYYFTKDTTDPTKCCYRAEIWSFSCLNVYTSELVKLTDSGWVSTATDTLSITRPMFFDFCTILGDTTKYVIFLRDSSGNVVCQKEFKIYCKDCCASIDAQMIPAPPPSSGPHGIDYCCWDFYYYPQSFEGCPSPYSWYLYDEHDTVPQQFPMYLTSMGYNMGRHCVIVHSPAPPPPGVSYTVWTSIKKQLALYDVNGNLICVKIMEDSCSRTYSSPGGGDGTGGGGEPFELTANPNPSSGVFGVEMNLPSTMPVEIKVINSSGVQVFQNNYGEQPQGQFITTINISGQPNGVYTLLVNNGEASIQVVKQ